MAAVERQFSSGLLQTSHVTSLDLQFNPVALRAALPAELVPADSAQGFLLLFSSEAEPGQPVQTGAYLAAFLKGRDAPDGSPGVFVTDGFYSANLPLAQSYTSRFGPGETAIAIDGDVIDSRISVADAPLLSMSMRLHRDRRVLNMGTHQYYGLREGGLTTYSIAFSAPIYAADLLDLAIAPDAPPLLRSIERINVLGANYAPGAPLTFSPVRPIAPHEPIASADSAHQAIVDVLASVGRAAVVVDADGKLLFGNARGLAAMQPLVRQSRVALNDPAEQRAFAALVRDAARQVADPGRLALHRPDGSPVLVQATTYRGGWRGVATALLLVYDPQAEAQIGPVEGLELLGLTPAEARIAAAIAQGLSARGASETLTLSEHTIRSALKTIYAKLGIANRTQLAGIVAQLRMPTG